jgi:aryl-alcohol dehydrogenase-like predicted oxidoreductase
VGHHLLRYHSFIRGLGVEPVTAALGFLAGLPQVDYAVVGVASTGHLEQAVAALARQVPNPAELAGFAWHDDAVLDPSRWS